MNFIAAMNTPYLYSWDFKTQACNQFIQSSKFFHYHTLISHSSTQFTQQVENFNECSVNPRFIAQQKIFEDNGWNCYDPAYKEENGLKIISHTKHDKGKFLLFQKSLHNLS